MQSLFSSIAKTLCAFLAITLPKICAVEYYLFSLTVHNHATSQIVKDDLIRPEKEVWQSLCDPLYILIPLTKVLIEHDKIVINLVLHANVENSLSILQCIYFTTTSPQNQGTVPLKNFTITINLIYKDAAPLGFQQNQKFDDIKNPQ